VLTCQIRTLASPSPRAPTRPSLIAKGPTADTRFPQFPDQSIIGASIDTAPNRNSTSQSSRRDFETSTTLLVLDVAPPMPSMCLP